MLHPGVLAPPWPPCFKDMSLPSGLGATEVSPCVPRSGTGGSGSPGEGKAGAGRRGHREEKDEEAGPGPGKLISPCPAAPGWRNAKLSVSLLPLAPCPSLALICPQTLNVTNMTTQRDSYQDGVRTLAGCCQVSSGRIQAEAAVLNLPASQMHARDALAGLEHETAGERWAALVPTQVSRTPSRGPYDHQ